MNKLALWIVALVCFLQLSFYPNPLISGENKARGISNLYASYYDLADLVWGSFVITKPYTEPIDFEFTDWGGTSPFEPLKLTEELEDGSDYSVRWRGKLIVPDNGRYTFILDNVDDGARIYIDNNPITDQGWYWPDPELRPSPRDVFLTKGQHNIRIDYEQRVYYRAALRVKWSGPNFSEEVIPVTSLDFYVSEIKPIQVINECDINNDNRIDLVSGKKTVTIVSLEMENTGTLGEDHVVEVQLKCGSFDNTISKTIAQLKQDNHLEFYFTPSDIGDKDIMVRVDQDNKILEFNENNNQTDKEITIKDTNDLYLVYFPVDRTIFNSGYGPIDLTQYSETASKSGVFIKATYPVAQNEFTNQRRNEKYYGDPIPLLGMFDDALSLWLWGKLLTGGSADRAIGIVPDDYFPYHGYGGVAGMFMGFSGVLVKVDYWTAAAHEIAHSYHLRLGPPLGPGEEYDTDPPGIEANGFWVEEKKEISNGLCFMGFAGPRRSFDYEPGRPYWVGDDDYVDLFKKFRVNKVDPDIVLFNGLLHKDKTVELGKLYFIKQGEVDDVLEGDYSVEILDFYGQTLEDIPFHAFFEIYIDPLGIQETDIAAFAFAIPYPENASKILINYKGKTLTEINPNTKLLHDAVDSIPDHGFVGQPWQRKKALHNKINALEKMLEKNNIKGARQKLEKDIKDKFEKWLLDNYQKENPAQLSKIEVIDLVNEIIQRLKLML
jgi:hypothetical protein